MANPIDASGASGQLRAEKGLGAAAITQTYSTAARTLTQVSTAPSAGYVQAEAAGVRNDLITLTNVVNALIDDLQAYGFVL